MRIDFHVHSCYSHDGLASPAAIIAACRSAGLDKIALTDHNTIQGALALRDMAPDLIIVGEEIRTDSGELLALFVREEVPAGLAVGEAIRRLRAQGAVIGVSHPVDRLRREAMGLENVLRIIDQVDFLETYNSRCLFAADNQRAAELAAAHHLPGSAGSDAHNAGHIGRACVEMPAFSDAASFLASLRQGTIHGRPSGLPVHFLSTYAKWRRRFAGKKRGV
jgi:predicted metal-dependent phosphoesterase TrpH